MKYYIYWDEDYNGSDRDSLLEVAKTEEEKEKIIDDWCSHKAYALFKKDMSREEKQTIKALFRKQLFVTDRPRYN